MRQAYVVAVALSLILARPSIADEHLAVGTVAELNHSVSELLRGTVDPVTTTGRPVYEGSTLRTTDTGRLYINFHDEYAEELARNSELVLTVSGETPECYHFEHQLKHGQVRVLKRDRTKDGENCPGKIVTTAGRVTDMHTDFIVVFDGRTMTVITLDGEVSVESIPPRRDGKVLVRANQLVTVERGKAPSAPRDVDANTVQQYVQATAFIGDGTLESQTIAHPLLGTAVSASEGHESLGPPAIPGDPEPPRDPGPGGHVKPVFVPRGGVGVQF